MLAISGYEDLKLVYKGSSGSVFSGVQSYDQNRVRLKHYEPSSILDIQEFDKRFEKFQRLTSPGIARAHHLIKEIRNQGEDRLLVFEDVSGISLKEYLGQGLPSIEMTLKIGIQLSKALADLHAARITHGKINPSGIVIGPDDRTIKISDFDCLPPRNYTQQETQRPDMISTFLPYISPEQTGRTLRIINFQTDLYAIGIILYECLTGLPPFLSDDPHKLIHAHLAQDPADPSKTNKKIPKILSKIVLKLLSKAPEDRYIGAWGVRADLNRCLKQWKDSRYLSLFELAQQDVPHILTTPQKIYGRKIEFNTLVKTYKRIISRATGEIMFITGSSGIGKSALVKELKSHVLKSMKGYFISGKFDQMKRNIPYEPLIQALDELIKIILSESKDQISIWRKNLLNILGPNGQVVIDVNPNLELIIGKQPEIPELGPVESQNRFNFVLGNLIQTIATKEHPLILFLDDLQWADPSSLKMIEVFMSIETKHLFILGTFRDNEVSETHPLSMTIEKIKNFGGIVNKIGLGPLERSHINQLLCDTMACDPEHSTELARICVKKTRGNPFFLDQFIKSLYHQNLIAFDSVQENWKWDIEKISKKQITENVIEYMAKEIDKLSSSAKSVLTLAACIGNEFDLNILTAVNKKSAEKTFEQLQEPLQKELIVLSKNRQETTFTFPHDRIHQAVYMLLDKEQKTKTHLQIGRLLLKRIQDDQLEEHIFDIVYQLNLGPELIKSPNEKEALIKLNLRAANKAKTSAAFGPAFNYLTAGMALLETDCWESQYELALGLHETAAEIAYLNGDFDKTYRLADTVIKKAINPMETVVVYEAKLRAYAMENNLPDSIETGLIILKKLGVNFPKKSTDLHIIIDVLKTKLALIGKQPEDVLKLPEASDLKTLAIMRILKFLGISAYLSDPKLAILLCLKGFSMTIKHGHIPEAPNCDLYGLVLCLLGDINTGYRYGQTSLDLINKLNTKVSEPHVLLNFNSLIRHWKEHLKEALSPLLSAYQKSLETGNLEFAGYSSLMYCINSYFCGKHLETLESEIKKYGHFMGQIRQDTTLQYNQIFHQTILNLMGENENPTHLIGEQYDEEKMLPIHIEAKDESALFDIHFHKLVLCYLFEEHHMAIDNAGMAEKYLEVVLAQPETPLFHLYDSLTRLAIFPEATKLEQKKILRKVGKNQKKMKKWAHHAPMNCLHKYYLVEAEQYRIGGKKTDAMDYYDRAIASAKENEYIQEEALANELSAKFYLAQNKNTIAGAYMQKAYDCYLKWGAHAKVKHLETRYSQFFNHTLKQMNTDTRDDKNDQKKPGVFGYGTDLASVIQAVKAISSEKAPGRLLERLMKIVIENAGARKGYLILKKDDQFIIETRISINKNSSFRYPKKIENCKDLCPAVINYTIRTSKSVLLNEATVQGQFTGDPYIKENQIKSILSMPISDKGRMTGILYLENGQIAGAFTPERVEILRTVGEIIANAWARLEAEENLLTHRAQLQSLSSQILLTQEQERRRIAVDLHDRIGHALSSIMLNLGAFKQTSSTSADDGIIDEISNIVEQCIEDTHSLTFEISPPILYDLGLEAALDWLAEQTQTKHKIQIRVEDDEQEKPLDENLRVLLFQASRELLFNMVKHSQAASATISIKRIDQHIKIVIEDDGIGFDPEKERYRKNKTGGFGLFSIQERMAQQEGIFEINSAPGNGTRITMISPMKSGEKHTSQYN